MTCSSEVILLNHFLAYRSIFVVALLYYLPCCSFFTVRSCLWFQALPESLRNGDAFSVRVVFWNLGINHEATLSQSIAGDSSLERSINILAANNLQSYVNTLEHPSQSLTETVADLCASVCVMCSYLKFINFFCF